MFSGSLPLGPLGQIWILSFFGGSVVSSMAVTWSNVMRPVVVVCRSLLSGVLVVLHIGSQRTMFVESLSRYLQMPLVTSSAPQPITARHHAVTSSPVLYMHPPLLAIAVADVIIENCWPRAYYVYDSSEGDKILTSLCPIHDADATKLSSCVASAV